MRPGHDGVGARFFSVARPDSRIPRHRGEIAESVRPLSSIVRRFFVRTEGVGMSRRLSGTGVLVSMMVVAWGAAIGVAQRTIQDGDANVAHDHGFVAKDPGPRPNPSSAIPQPVDNLNDQEAALFNESLLRVSELEGSCDTCSQQPPNTLPIDHDPNTRFSPTSLVNSAGMSPVFNADQCFICHSQPMIGGSTPAHSPADTIAHRLGGTNVVPSFEAPDGPFREVRFKYHAD